MKRIISFILVMSLLFSLLTLPCSASESNSLEGALNSQDFTINGDVAYYLAKFFIRDMMSAGTTKWTEQPDIIKVTPMYNGMGEEVTAYTAELSQGYVVISAYSDIANFILEWSDEAEPIYSSAQKQDTTRIAANREEPKIIYAGELEYYLDYGDDSVVSCNGVKCKRQAITNSFEELRNEENVSLALLESLRESGKKDNSGIAPQDNGVGEIITDPYEYAKKQYAYEYKPVEWRNYWEPYTNFAVYHSFPQYKQCCVPVAIANAVIMFGNQYKKSPDDLWLISNSQAFNKVIEMNKQDPAYINPEGVPSDRWNKVGGLAERTFAAFGADEVSTYGGGEYRATYDNIRNATTKNRLILLDVTNSAYGRHCVVGYACNKMQSTNKERTYSFLKIVDGCFNDGGRYLDIDSLTACDNRYWELYFGAYGPEE